MEDDDKKVKQEAGKPSGRNPEGTVMDSRDGAEGNGAGIANGADGDARVYRSDDDILRLYAPENNPYRRLSLAEVEKLRRMQRGVEIINGIGDLSRAISNLFFTTRYAPNSYNHESDSVSKRSRERFDKMLKDRLDEHDAFMRFAMARHGAIVKRDETAYQRDLDKAKAERQAQIDMFNQEYKQKELEYKELLAQGRHAEAEAKLAEMRRLNDARIEYYQKTGNAAVTRAQKAGSGGRSGTSTPYSITVYGETESFNKPQERRTAILKYAKQLGIPTKDIRGSGFNKREVNRDIDEIAADIEIATRGKKRPGNNSRNDGRKTADLGDKGDGRTRADL